MGKNDETKHRRALVRWTRMLTTMPKFSRSHFFFRPTLFTTLSDLLMRMVFLAALHLSTLLHAAKKKFLSSYFILFTPLSNLSKRLVLLTTPHCNTLHHTATHCITLQHIAPHCNTLHHTAAHCITLQHTSLLVLLDVQLCRIY